MSRVVELIRIVFILGIAFSSSFLFPPVALSASTGTIVATLVLFAFLLGFFINRALERKQMISRCVSLELLHLRHTYHLCENVQDKNFAKRIIIALTGYQSAVGRSFLSHAKTGESFRKVSHLIYSYKTKSDKDEILFADLLNTVREVALERQQIEQALANKLSGYSWVVMLTNAISAVVLLLVNRFEPQYSPLGCAFLISSILLSLDLLLRTDQLSKSEIKAFETAYRFNIPHRKSQVSKK